MQRCTRREFFKHGGRAGLALGTSGLLSGCGTLFPAGDVALTPITRSEVTSRVAVARGLDLRQMTRDVLNEFGTARAIVQPGETVFIKPNLVGAGMVHHALFSTGECTKPEIFLTVAEECLAAGAAEVIIGDGGQVASFSWDEMLTLDGSTSVPAEVARLNALYDGTIRLACLNSESPAWDTIASPYSGLGELRVSSLAARADRLITIPVVKTHRFAQLSLSFKNLMGLTSSEYYGIPGMTYRMKIHDAPGGLVQTFLDLAAGLRPDFTIIDASIGCEGNGPHVLPGWWGTTADTRDHLGDWLILGSDDPLAADATTSRIIGHEPSEIEQLCMAYDRGLGQLRQDLIDLRGGSLDDLRMDWEPAEVVAGFEEVTIPGIMMLLEGGF